MKTRYINSPSYRQRPDRLAQGIAWFIVFTFIALPIFGAILVGEQ